MNFIEAKRWEIEKGVTGLVMSLELFRLAARETITMPEIVANNTGDFAGAYFLNFMLNSFMNVTPPFDRMPRRVRFMLNAAITLGESTAFETLPLLNTPDIWDMPAAVGGVLVSLGVRKFAERWVRRQTESAVFASNLQAHNI